MAITKKCARDQRTFSHGLYRRYEIIDLKEGSLLKFDQELYYEMNPISATVARSFEQITGKKEVKNKLEDFKPHTYVEFAGYRNGEPFIVVRNARRKVVTVSAFGYVIAEGQMKGRDICEKVACSEKKMNETTV